jgi:hypothetical protein
MGVTNFDTVAATGLKVGTQTVTGRIAAGTQAAAITNATAAAGDNPTKAEFDAVVTKLNAALAALRTFGIIAS